MHQLTFARSLALLVLASAISGSTGCTSLASVAPPGPGLASAHPSVKAASPQQPGVPPLVVEFRPQENDPERVQVAWQDSMTVQSILQASRAERRFSRLKVEVHRAAPNGLGVEKLGIKYNNAKNKVDPASDYAIYPGDRVIVTEDPSTIISDMLGGAKDTIAVFSTR